VKTRWLIAFLILLLLGTLGHAAWIGYQVIGTYELNSSFCADYQGLQQQRTAILNPFQNLLKENLTKSLLDQEVQMPMDSFLKDRLKVWTPFRDRFESRYLSTFQQNYTQISEQLWPSDFVCQPGKRPFAWLNLPVLWKEKWPAANRFKDNQIKEWTAKLKEIESMLPSIKKQMEKDQKILCSTAENIRRNQKIEAYYLERCTNCQKKSDFLKIRSLLERNKSLLQQNWVLFRMKWSQITPACLRGFTDDRGQILDSAFIGQPSRVGTTQ
jgi:hypothetical protein